MALLVNESSLEGGVASPCFNYSLSTNVKVVYALVSINVLASVAGTFGNLLVCIAVLTTNAMTSSFHYFVASLAAADLAVAFLDQPLLVALIVGRLHTKCLFNLDTAFRIVGNFACAVSIATLSFIALDRCLFVTQMIEYKNNMTRSKRVVMAFIWMLAAVYTSARLTLEKEITSYLTAAVFGICYMEMFVCYGVTYCQVHKQLKLLTTVSVNPETVANRQDGEPANEILELKARVKDNRRERAFARTIVMVVSVFTCAWGLLFYLRVTQPDKNYGVMYNVARTVALSSSALNPMLYCFNNKEYRRAFKRLLRKLFFVTDQDGQRKQYEKIK